MKIAAIIARILLGLMFVIFGLNGFLNFIHGPIPGGIAGTFIGALIQSHFIYFVSGVQLIAGIFLLINRYVPFALVLLAAMIANILVFHLTMQPSGLPPGIFAAILWMIVAARHRAYLEPLLVQKAVEEHRPLIK
jgi:putative oxidoreductase